MAQPQATRSIIDTHRHIFGPKLRQKLVENIGFDDSKPLPQVFGDEMFSIASRLTWIIRWRFSGKAGSRSA
jgi:hypothetical protein